VKKKYIIACSKKWFIENYSKKKLKKNFVLITKKNDLNISKILKINPRYIFFPHWSYVIPKNIYNTYECIIFHTSPLPYGRGGSPIQNLIKRNFKNSPVCAIRVEKNFDTGPIYKKYDISLNGNLDEIFKRITLQIEKLIKFIIKNKPQPKKQRGRGKLFIRLKPKNSIIKKNEENINKIYNKIRMLDSKEYPKAFICYGKFKIYFEGAKIINNKIETRAIIQKSKISNLK